MKTELCADYQDTDLDTTASSSDLVLIGLTCKNRLLSQDWLGNLHKGETNEAG